MRDVDELTLSPAVVLEIELLHEIQRLRFDAKHLLGALAQDFGVTIAPDKFSAVALHSLSMSFTRDPFDRLITAHASLIKAPLITLDSRILDNYLGALSWYWAITRPVTKKSCLAPSPTKRFTAHCLPVVLSMCIPTHLIACLRRMD
jgi:PIN domain nuclease of toxin-antitoxin system